MKNNLSAFLFLVFLFGGNQIFAQKIEEKLFHKLCAEIYNQNESFLIKKKLEGKALLIEDPVTGDQEIRYTSEEPSIVEFKKRKKEEQLEILNAIEIPNLPLNDTVVVIDSSGIFTTGLMAKFGDKVFLRKGKDQILPGSSPIAVRSLVLRGDAFLISCSFPNNTMVSLYYFNFEKEGFVRKRLSYIYLDDPHFKH